MTPRRSSRIASERLGSEGDVEYVLQPETTPIHTKRGRPATNSTPGKRTTIRIRKGNKSSPIRENDLEEENASLGEKEMRTTPEMAEKRSLQVSNTTDPAPKRLKFDDAFQNSVQALQDSYYQVKQQLLHATEKTMALKISAQDLEIEVETLRDENSKLSKLVDNLKTEAACLKKSNKSIQRKYRQLENDSDEIKQSAIQALDDAKIHHADELPTISLDIIDKEWRHLVYCIHDLVVQNLTSKPAHDGHLQNRRGIGKLIQVFRECPDLQISCLERCIWRYIHRVVFQANSALWGGAAGFTLTKICGEPRVRTGLSVMDVMKYRAAETLISRLGVNERQRLIYIEDIYEGLAPYKINPVTTGLREGVVLVFDYAINIMKMFMKSRDIYGFGTCFEDSLSRQVVYDKESMKISSCLAPGSPDRNQSERFKVLVVHNPPLFVISMTEGEYFGRKELVCHADVTVSVEKVADDDTEKGSDGPKEVSDDDTEEESDGLKSEASHEANDGVVS